MMVYVIVADILGANIKTYCNLPHFNGVKLILILGNIS